MSIKELQQVDKNWCNFNNFIEVVKKLYKNDRGEPFELSPSQAEIFALIAKREKPRSQVITFSQFGKTEVVALAVLTRVTTFPEKWAIVAPDFKRAKILIEKIINHIFDNPYTLQKFQIAEGESLERIRRERSKNRLTFNTGDGIGEIIIVSAQARFKGEDAGNALMGFGGPNLICEEASLIPDDVYSKAIRMIGGHKDNFLIKIGNPFHRNHFFKSWQNEKYHKIKVDWRKGVEEGRISAEQVEEYGQEIPDYLFRILYDCEFPPEGGMIGWKQEYERIGQLDLNDFQMFAIGSDLAISEREEADFSAINIAGLGKDGKIYSIKSEQGKWSLNEFLENLTNEYRFYSKRASVIIGIEDVGYQRVAQQELYRRFGVSAYLVKRTKDKRARVMMLQPYFQNAQIYFFSEQKALFEQLRDFGTMDKDDLVDAMEMSISLIKDNYLLKEKEEKSELTFDEMRKQELAEAIKRTINDETKTEFQEDYTNL